VPCGTAPTDAELLANHIQCQREATADGCTLVNSFIEPERKPTGECVFVGYCTVLCPPGGEAGGGQTEPVDPEPTGPVNPEPDEPIVG
jgi:hypothetical protein